MLSLTLAPANTPAPGVDIAQVIGNLLPTLGAISFADLAWCAPDGSEFYQWADEYAKRLARHAGVFVTRDTSTEVAANQASYETPEGFIDAIHVSIDGVRIRPSSVQDLEALDATWSTSTGVVERYSMDAEGMLVITLYRIPTGAGELDLIMNTFPVPALAASSSVLSIASPVGDYFQYGMLAEARRKQSEGQLLDIAEHADQRVLFFEQIFKQYWGGDE